MLVNSQKAFTLVELAVVLVIIGLIISSVLAGRELIKNAELRALVTQYNQYQTAVSTFIAKYNAIPGDAEREYGLDPVGVHGDGDGLLEDEDNTDVGVAVRDQLTGEVSSFWSNLTTEGRELIAGTYNGDGGNQAGIDFPNLRSGPGGWGVFTSNGKNYFLAGVVDGASDSSYFTNNAFVPLDAYNIDEKIDDGVPDAGTVQARQGSASDADPDSGGLPSGTAGVNNTTCMNTTPEPHEYQYNATTLQCTLRFDMATF